MGFAQVLAFGVVALLEFLQQLQLVLDEALDFYVVWKISSLKCDQCLRLTTTHVNNRSLRTTYVARWGRK